jgi:hypothetical protein
MPSSRRLDLAGRSSLQSETGVEAEHGGKRRRNPTDQVIETERAPRAGRAEALDGEARPYRITTKLIRELIDQMTGLLDHAPLETRLAWSGTCSSGSAWTASSSVWWPAGRRQPIRMLTANW